MPLDRRLVVQERLNSGILTRSIWIKMCLFTAPHTQRPLSHHAADVPKSLNLDPQCWVLAVTPLPVILMGVSGYYRLEPPIISRGWDEPQIQKSRSRPIYGRGLLDPVSLEKIHEFGLLPVNSCYSGLGAMDIVIERHWSLQASTWNGRPNHIRAAVRRDHDFIGNNYGDSPSTHRRYPLLRLPPQFKRMR